MKVYRVDYGVTHPVEVECAEFKLLECDADGKRMYENTHFIDLTAAWKKLKREAAAGQSLAASDFVQAQSMLRRKTEDLAKAAAFRSAVDAEFARSERERR